MYIFDNTGNYILNNAFVSNKANIGITDPWTELKHIPMYTYDFGLAYGFNVFTKSKNFISFYKLNF